jgi:methionyl-tRNA formyltransferase
MLRVLLAGQKYFGFSVFNALSALPNVTVSAVACPVGGEREDKLYTVAAQKGVTVIKSGTLNAQTFPPGIDLIVTAHSHDFIGEQTRLKACYGGIGYHPSLLPVHRGRDAVKWAVRMRERVTGGTVYRLSNRVDGGAVLLQEHVFIHQDDTPEELWRRDLCPLGVRLLAEAVARIRDNGFIPGKEQDETLATWEPSLDAPPVHRPDLLLLGRDDIADEVIAENVAYLKAYRNAPFFSRAQSCP